LAVALLLIANTINIAVDLAAMGAATRLVITGPPELYVIAYGMASLLLQGFVPYERSRLFSDPGQTFEVASSQRPLSTHNSP
ncbi:hypothetical protein CA603_03080, partial [Paraburkholderia hospita]